MTASMSGRPDDTALWRSVQDTLENLVIPTLKPGFELDSARQLVGVARYAQARAGETGARMSAQELAEAADLLVASVGGEVEGADTVREQLKAVLAEDIAEAIPLMETFSGHTPIDASEDAVEVPEAPALKAWFEQQLGTPVELAVSVMVGGHSRRMLNAKVTANGEVQQLIVRIEQGGMFGTEGTSEAKVMKAVGEAGYTAPTVRWIVTDSDALGQPFFVMDRVAGSPVVEDQAVIDTYVTTLGNLHKLDPSIAVEGLGPVPATPEAAISANVDHYLGIYRDSVEVRIPLLEEAAEWLRANLRPTGPVSLVHGDPGVGNFLHVDGEITSLTDWELTHYGDPAEDWTYFGAIRGRKMHDVATWRAKFADHADVKIDDRDWLAWEAFNQLKGACVNLTALRIFNQGVNTMPNLLAIGTAVHLRFLNRLTEIVSELR